MFIHNIGLFDPDNPDIRYSKDDREAIADYVRQYGAIKPGENPVREVEMPKRKTDT